MISEGSDSYPKNSLSSDRETQRSRRRRLVLCLCVMSGGIVLSCWLAWTLWVRERDVAKVQFALDAGKRIEAIQRAVTDRLGTIGTVTAFFNGSQVVERAEFRTFTAPFFENHPGIVALGWVPRIPAARRDAHREMVRRKGFEKYEITQRNDAGQYVDAGRRDEYYPILFLEPFRENRSMIGFDLGSNPACRKAIRQAMATRRQVAVVCPPLDETRAIPTCYTCCNRHGTSIPPRSSDRRINPRSTALCWAFSAFPPSSSGR